MTLNKTDIMHESIVQRTQTHVVKGRNIATHEYFYSDSGVVGYILSIDGQEVAIFRHACKSPAVKLRVLSISILPLLLLVLPPF